MSDTLDKLEFHQRRNGILAYTHRRGDRLILEVTGIQRWVDGGLEVDITGMNTEAVRKWITDNFPRIPLQTAQKISSHIECWRLCNDEPIR